ncbi:recombinase RecT [Nitratireductor aquibiodomus]|uniref:recombinase RecT n=1 Tax=Nitratireductor aquibiodomus TaxID=204799 RepID=UPI0019D398D9|nr:recombinase RecT [Nitratireductor aquibiodomus]MBN7763533.1 recombinase RecT [Nitratireductor aquibiodomus]
MNQVTRTDDRMVAIENRINQQVSSAISVGTGGISFQNAGEVMEYAKMMAVSGSAVPKHLRGQPGACLGIIDDAIRFQTSPYALARKSYFVNDNLAYEAQVLAGIVNAHAPLKQRPQIIYEGDGSDRVCIVTGEFRDGAVREYRSPAIGKITPKNSPLWKNDPDQQLAYYSLRGFARRHCPEILLGVYDIEEMRSIDHRNDEPRQSLADRLSAARQEPQEAREGFDMANVTRETEGLSSGQEIHHEHSSPAESPTGDGSGALVATNSDRSAAENSPATADEAGSQDMGESESEPTSVDPDWLKTFAKAIIGAIGEEQQVVLNQAEGMKRDDLPEDIRARARSITKHALSCCRNEIELSDCIDMIAGVAGVDEKELMA